MGLRSTIRWTATINNLLTRSTWTSSISRTSEDSCQNIGPLDPERAARCLADLITSDLQVQSDFGSNLLYSVMLVILNGALVSFGSAFGAERSQIAPLASFGVFLARVQTIFPIRQFSNHENVTSGPVAAYGQLSAPLCVVNSIRACGRNCAPVWTALPI